MSFVERLSESRTRFRAFTLASHRNFILYAGVLTFGLSFGIGMGVALPLTDDLANHPAWEKVLIAAGWIFVLGPLTGLFWGWAMWQLRGLWLKRVDSEHIGGSGI